MCSCTVPGPVSDLSATPGVVQLTISWTAPSEPNGVITMYQVTHNSTGVLNYTNTGTTHSQISLVDSMLETASPGPMIVYALTLYSTAVLGGRSLSVSCVADVLV